MAEVKPMVTVTVTVVMAVGREGGVMCNGLMESPSTETRCGEGVGGIVVMVSGVGVSAVIASIATVRAMRNPVPSVE